MNPPGVASSIAEFIVEFIVSGENYRRDSNDQLPELGVRLAHGEFLLVGATGPLVPESVPDTVKSNLTFSTPSTPLNVLLHIVICTRLPANFVLDPAFASFGGNGRVLVNLIPLGCQKSDSMIQGVDVAAHLQSSSQRLSPLGLFSTECNGHVQLGDCGPRCRSLGLLAPRGAPP